MIMINNDTHGNLTEKEVKKVLKQYQKAAIGEVMMKITVGLGTCGIAAGARRPMRASRRRSRRPASRSRSRRPGCIGMCYREPLVEVRTPTTARGCSTAT